MKIVGLAVMAGVLAAGTWARAQVPAPYVIETEPGAIAGDPDDAYAAMPRSASAPQVLPPRMISRVARANGFALLGLPRARGPVYTVSVISPDGDDGRLVVDARSGRIRSFTPARLMSDRFDDELVVVYGSGRPPVGLRRPPRPPASVPRVASLPREVPVPKAAPHRVKPVAARAVGSEPAAQPHRRPKAARRSADVARAAPAHDAAPAPALGKPPDEAAARPAAPAILPTQAMPPVQGLD
ncbi:MAG: hypothetical protein KDJ76_05370 [Xanthobacteraceae bacterium]|nr:hypothetical protein [Xanthobacteraceae bacterium]